jgi:hypothetical protein
MPFIINVGRQMGGKGFTTEKKFTVSAAAASMGTRYKLEVHEILCLMCAFNVQLRLVDGLNPNKNLHRQ